MMRRGPEVGSWEAGDRASADQRPDGRPEAHVPLPLSCPSPNWARMHRGMRPSLEPGMMVGARARYTQVSTKVGAGAAHARPSKSNLRNSVCPKLSFGQMINSSKFNLLNSPSYHLPI